MSLPGNGIFVVRGEMSTMITAMRRGARKWNSTSYVDEEKDGLIKLFMNLKLLFNRVEDLRLIEPNIYLTPFLEVIRTDETTGADTSLALAAINKFLSYGLLDPTSPHLAVTVENIVDAVTHARFMGTDQSSDTITLFRVVEVLQTLMRSPEGSVLTNEAVCEVMLSCFKICFEPRLNSTQLLQRFAEQALKDIVQLLFMRLPQFSEVSSETGFVKKFQMMAAAIDKNKKSNGNKRRESTKDERKISTTGMPGQELASPLSTAASTSTTNLNVNQVKTLPVTGATSAGTIVDLQGKITQTLTTTANERDGASGNQLNIDDANAELNAAENLDVKGPSPLPSTTSSSEYINSLGVRFTHQQSVDDSEGFTALVPYGLPCIQELFRFLILLCNPLDAQNTDTMKHMGLSLLTVAFEVAADNIGKYDTLLQLVKDDLCRHLFALLNSERLSIFAADLQLCFLLFESLRGHLKFQLEAYLKKVSEIIFSDNPKTPYEMRELALDNLLQLWRIPGFVTELYINYDCDLYCSNLFENITNLLCKYTLTATNVVYNTHLIALDAIISVVDNIEQNCAASKSDGNTATGDPNCITTSCKRHSRHNSDLEGIIIDVVGGVNAIFPEDDGKVENISKYLNNSSRIRCFTTNDVNAKLLSRECMAEVKHKKSILTQGTELFNQRPEKGIEYLQKHGILKEPLDPREIALFLRENLGLDKKVIGEYICKKKNIDAKILMNFVESFDFNDLRVDQALRLFLEAFRLSGEAPLIFLILEYFVDHWRKQNGEPFANADAAFRLAYAIIMLNTDQHNANAKTSKVPMTQEDFLKNLRGLNGGEDFNQDMLVAIFNSIKNDEIVMPAEQTGLVRENYLWKVLLKRGLSTDGMFKYVNDSNYDLDIFKIIWGPFLSSLGFMFDRSSESDYQRTLKGFTKCAGITFHYNLYEDFDALVLTLCKFTTLLPSAQQEAPNSPVANNEIVQAVNFGLNPKGQAAMRTVFALVHDYGDCLREGWRHVLDLYLQLFRLKLLPKSLMEVEDFCEATGKAQLILEKPNQKQESGLFSSLYSYLSSDGQREPSAEEKEVIKLGKKCIRDCQLDQMIQESKFVHLDSLQELLRHVLHSLKAPNAHKSIGIPYAEDVMVFWMEFLVKIVIYNRDRMIPLWPTVRDQMYLLLLGGASCGYTYLLNRCIVALLKLAIYLMRNEELCPVVLKSLKMLLMLKPASILRISKQISIGMYELLKTSAQNIHTEEDWQIVFTILECVGAGREPPEFDDASLPVPLNGLSAKSDGALSSEDDSGLPDKGYLSESELLTGKQTIPKQIQKTTNCSNTSSPPYPSSPISDNWILVNKDTDLGVLSRPQSPPGSAPPLTGLVYDCKLLQHSPYALFKCWDSLAFIVRNVAHITPYNFESCVRCIRTFVEACRDGGWKARRKFENVSAAASNNQQKKNKHKRGERNNERSRHLTTSSSEGAITSEVRSDGEQEEDENDLAQRYETLSIQLLDLMYTLYTRTAQIFRWWAEEGCAVPQCSALWAQGWCPVLQGIARLAMDRRREVRTYAISCLQQRALLVHDLQALSGTEWASCFYQVLFPLLNELLPDSANVKHLDPLLLEESRIRTATIMSKVFLHHLTPLLELRESFNELWLHILNYIEKFMKVGSDMLSEQMQEVLKNMLLVMHSVRIFHNPDGSLHMALWSLTWQRIGEFLPHLKNELFRDEGNLANVGAGVNNSNNNNNNNNNIVATSQQIPPTDALNQKSSNTNSNNNNNNNISTSTIAVFPRTELRSPLLSPTESPRHSIILQPPTPDILNCPSILSQMPVIVPQQLQLQQQQLKQQQQQEQQQPITSEPSAKISVDVENALNLSPIHVDQQPQQTEYQQQQIITDNVRGERVTICNLESTTLSTTFSTQNAIAKESPSLPAANNAFTIELPEDVPTETNIIYNNSRTEWSNNNLTQQDDQFVSNDSDVGQYEKQQLIDSNHLITAERNDGNDVCKLPDIRSDYNLVESLSASECDAQAAVKVPISHVMAGNTYPSLSHPPNSAIVQSFTPVAMTQISQTAQPTTDIYQEYVQNPYNLTLHHSVVPETIVKHQEHTHTVQQQQQQQQQHQPHYDSNSVVNTPANYFSTPIDGNIPPDSEMLYGRP